MNGKFKTALRGTGLAGGGAALVFIFNFAVSYGEVKKDVVYNTERIVEVKKEVKGNTDDIDIEENVNIEQTTLLKGLTATVNGLNQRIQKELAK